MTTRVATRVAKHKIRQGNARKTLASGAPVRRNIGGTFTDGVRRRGRDESKRTVWDVFQGRSWSTQ